MRGRLCPIFFWTVLSLTVQPILAEGGTQDFPAWVTKVILEHRNSRSRDIIEESAYNGQRTFLFIRGDRADTGDEHVLFGEDGKQICKFGGYVGRVTAGSCDIDKITYVRTLYPVKSQ